MCEFHNLCSKQFIDKGPAMYPSKSLLEYMIESSRLFPKPSDNDISQSPTTSSAGFPSPLNQNLNRSSSSTDSTSPESFPDLFHRTDFNRLQFEAPYPRRQRPIVGRKIFDKPSPTLEPTAESHEIRSSIWQREAQIPTPQHTSNLFMEQKNNSQSEFYELFPTETKGFEFKSPVKSNTRPYTVTSASSSPCFSPSQPSLSPNTPSFVPQYQFQYYNSPSSSSQLTSGSKLCTFCRKNGETPLVYTTHVVKEKIGNRHIVTCPILRSHVCSTCGSTGDYAHTITYCPVLRSSNNGRPLQSTTITLKNTRVKSNGRKRF